MPGARHGLPPTAACIVAYFIGNQPQDGSLWVYLETIGGGSGARATKDGLDGVHVHTTNTSNLPVEALEIEYPLTLCATSWSTDSGGAGQYRGGMGLRRVYRATHDCRVRVDITRQRSQSWGLFGGGPGGHGRGRSGPRRGLRGRLRGAEAWSVVRHHHAGRRRLRSARTARACGRGARSGRGCDQPGDGARGLRRARARLNSPDMTLSAAEAQAPAADRSEDGCWASTQNRSTVESCRTGLPATFISLRNPNFRIYLAAQIGSNIGTWIQITAENWLILQLTGSGLALGITNALQFGPLVFFGLYGGVVADRFDRRRLLIVTQGALALLAAAIGLLVVANLIQLWMIWLAALSLGLIMSIDRPALLGFVRDLVGEADRRTRLP